MTTRWLELGSATSTMSYRTMPVGVFAVNLLPSTGCFGTQPLNDAKQSSALLQYVAVNTTDAKGSAVFCLHNVSCPAFAMRAVPCFYFTISPCGWLLPTHQSTFNISRIDS